MADPSLLWRIPAAVALALAILALAALEDVARVLRAPVNLVAVPPRVPSPRPRSPARREQEEPTTKTP